MTMRNTAIGLAFVLAGGLNAQQAARQGASTTIDVNGRRVESATYTSVDGPGGSRREETVRSLNGRNVPLQSVEERVVKQDSQGKVVERVVRKYDADGRPGPPETVRINEKRNSDGSTTIEAVTYRADINGRPQLQERATTTVRKGVAVETSTVVERTTLNGSLELVERASSVEKPENGGKRLESTTFRRDVSGNFTPIAQEVKVTAKSGNQETVDTTIYEALPTGKLEISRREVGKTVTKADGSQVEAVDVYSRFSAGRAGDVNANAPRLQEQILRERAKGAGNTVVETTSVRARLPNDPSQFGTFERVAQTTVTALDAAGREVKSTTSITGRRDPNGEIAPREVDSAVTVKTK
jgi:hypothetical protein